jgi:hypothetical protein
VFKCATCQFQRASCSAAAVRKAYNGSGRQGEWDTSRNQLRNAWNSSSGYGASGRRADFGEISV